MVTDLDWLSVYKVTRVKGKVKVKHVCHEHYENCMVLHQKLHQEIPTNKKLLDALLEHSPTKIVHLQRKRLT